MVTRTRDHEITIGSTTRSLNLLRDTTGKAIYSMTEDIPAHLDNILFEQHDWVGGHGQYGMVNPSMYFDGQSIDTTQEGRILLGPEIKEVKSANTSTIKDYYNTGDDAGYSLGGAIWFGQSFTTTSAYTLGYIKFKGYKSSSSPGILTASIFAVDGAFKPTGSALVTGTMDGNSLIQDGTSVGAWYTITLNAGVALANGTMYALVLKCDANYVTWKADTSAPSYATGNYLYSADAGVNWTLAAANDFMFELYSASTVEMTATPTCFFWSTTAAKWLCASSDKTYYYNGASWIPATTALAGVTGFAEFNGVIFAALGTGTAYYYSTDGDTWTVSTLTDHHANYFLTAPSANGLTNVLWKASIPNQVASNTDGTDAGAVQWTTPAYIGDTTNNITNIFLSGDKLMVGRTDNLYTYDSDGTVHELMPDLKVSRTPQNFKYVAHWQGNTYFSVTTGLYELTSYNTLNKMGPLQDTGDIDKVGVVVGLAADIDYLYVAMAEGTVTHIYKGKTINGVWSWSPIVALDVNATVTLAVAQHSVTDKRLWFGFGTHTGYVYISDNPSADDNARFGQAGFLYTSFLEGSNPNFDKIITSVLVEAYNCSVDNYIQISYCKNSDNPLIPSGISAHVTTDGITKINLNASISCKRVKFWLTIWTEDSTISPEIRSFQVLGHEKPTTYKIHEATYNIYSDPATKASTLISFLEGGRTSTSLIKFARLNFGEKTTGTAGTDYKYVIMEPGYPKLISVYDEKNMQGDYAIQCRFREVNFT
jgi:hypothetical protein